MGKKVKEGNYFILKGRKGTYIRNKIEADFTPVKYDLTIPIFNKDRKYYTPSFIIPRLYTYDDQAYRAEHANKISSTAQKSEDNILVPKPGPRKKHCSVCSKQYEEYLLHIESASHKQQLKNSKYQSEILKLCQKTKAQNESNQHSLSMIEKKSTTATQIQEDESPVKYGFTKVCPV